MYARRVNKNELIPHGSAVFTTYEDADFDISYHHYYKPNEKFNALMEDYRDHPEKYPSDPALYTENELGLTDRESYYDVLVNGNMSEPATVSLKAGESFSLSNYSYDDTNFDTIAGAITNGLIMKTSTHGQTGAADKVRPRRIWS